MTQAELIEVLRTRRGYPPTVTVMCIHGCTLALLWDLPGFGVAAYWKRAPVSDEWRATVSTPDDYVRLFGAIAFDNDGVAGPTESREVWTVEPGTGNTANTILLMSCRHAQSPGWRVTAARMYRHVKNRHSARVRLSIPTSEGSYIGHADDETR